MPRRNRPARRGVRKVLNHIELEGQEEFREALNRFEVGTIRELKLVVTDSARDIEGEAKARVRVDSGKTRDSIRIETKDSGLTAAIGSSYPNARFEEMGTVHKAAKPFLFPAFEVVRPKYLQRVAKAVDKAGRDAGDAA